MDRVSTSQPPRKPPPSAHTYVWGTLFLRLERASASPQARRGRLRRLAPEGTAGPTQTKEVPSSAQRSRERLCRASALEVELEAARQVAAAAGWGAEAAGANVTRIGEVDVEAALVQTFGGDVL